MVSGTGRYRNFLGNQTASNTTATAHAKGKEVLRGPPPGFLAKDTLEVPQPSTRPTNPYPPRVEFLQECAYMLDAFILMVLILGVGGRNWNSILQLREYQRVTSLKEWFGASIFKDSMGELVTLKQQGLVEQYHDQFVENILEISPRNGFLTGATFTTRASPHQTTFIAA
ncbi:hypothetical protein CXB51_031423 [Gossypium anomalum]|uniref:Uncharacterized protein n=1 Tax=Gossypium anomalum TaxID=47600 RepID=A0A8J5XQQ4_9ROSI|nr:hypothetical protein CXB51_031423 [Gossypium anomalum]